MNLCLEQQSLWEDFHHGFISEARAALTRQLSPPWIVRIEEHLYAHELSKEARRRLNACNSRSSVAITNLQFCVFGTGVLA